MKIAVLNGSPKGNKSVTLQYVLYMQKKFPDLAFTVHPVAQKIHKLEGDGDAFQQVMEDIEGSDAVIWAFPLYFLLVCSQFKRFIELITERGAEGAFRDKYAVSLSTSVHFFDHTAHNYIHGICDDLRMRYLGDYSAAMYDLLRRKERQRFLHFAENFQEAVARNALTARAYLPLVRGSFAYVPGIGTPCVDTGGKRVVVLTDAGPGDDNLAGMVRTLKSQFVQEIEVANLHEADIGGGCLGCISCGYDNRCVYFGKDGYREFFETKVKAADVVVIAGTMRDRYLSSRWKLFFDRSFYNTHQPVLSGKQFGFLISGPLAQNPNLRQILSAYPECTGANLAGFVTDEPGDAALIDARLRDFAQTLIRLAGQGYRKPATFLGVGGAKVFRDEIWGPLRFAFLADHRYYRAHDMYRFPQKDYKVRLRNLIMTLLLSLPPTRRAIQKRFVDEMVNPLRYVVKNK
jgi:multimeric flavodoxin WrbA